MQAVLYNLHFLWLKVILMFSVSGPHNIVIFPVLSCLSCFPCIFWSCFCHLVHLVTFFLWSHFNAVPASLPILSADALYFQTNSSLNNSSPVSFVALDLLWILIAPGKLYICGRVLVFDLWLLLEYTTTSATGAWVPFMFFYQIPCFISIFPFYCKDGSCGRLLSIFLY